MQLDLGQWIVIGLCALLLAGYAYGYYTNRQLGERVVGWLHPALKQRGRVTAGERLGGMATGGRLHVKDASVPFQNIEAVFLLLPRENLVFWLFDRLRGRQDELILKINLRSAPKKNRWVEVSHHRDRDFQQAIDQANLSLSESLVTGLNIALADKDTPLPETLHQLLNAFGREIIQLSIRKQAPHVNLRIRLNPLLNQSAEELLSLLQQIFYRGSDENQDLNPDDRETKIEK